MSISGSYSAPVSPKRTCWSVDWQSWTAPRCECVYGAQWSSGISFRFLPFAWFSQDKVVSEDKWMKCTIGPNMVLEIIPMVMACCTWVCNPCVRYVSFNSLRKKNLGAGDLNEADISLLALCQERNVDNERKDRKAVTILVTCVALYNPPQLSRSTTSLPLTQHHSNALLLSSSIILPPSTSSLSLSVPLPPL